MLDQASGKVYLNEINTIPGSLSFYLWEPLGMKYEVLLDNMIELALKADREAHKVVYSFETNVLEGVKLGGGAKGSKM
jgi:D-alanine-D-alanine ligase